MQRLLIGLALTLVVLAAGTTNASDDEPALAPNKLNFVQGDDVWVPGWVFNDSEDWLALNCTEQICQLVRAELRVMPASWRGHHDDVATSGQQLAFSKSIDVAGEVVAWIKLDDELPWLRPGDIELYYAKELTPILQDKEDTYEIVVASSNKSLEYLAPVLRPSTGPDDERSQNHQGDPIFLRLRARGAQQLLSEQMAACSGELNLDYLLWAGDLDKDGKADYLIDYSEYATGPVKFYLSSYAKPGQLVGVAGVGITHPFDGDCA